MEEGEEQQGLSPKDGSDTANEPAPGPPVSPATEEPAGETKRKIDVLLKAVGDTPIMKNKKWTIEKTRTVQGLMDFIKKYLKLDSSEQLHEFLLRYERGDGHNRGAASLTGSRKQKPIHNGDDRVLKQCDGGMNIYKLFHLVTAGICFRMFIYVNQSFAPSPDQEVGTLYECFGSDGKLVLHYCKSQAWG